MCYERGLSAIYLEESDKVAQIEFIQHTRFIAKISGINPLKQPTKALKKTYDFLDLDMIWFTLDYIHPWNMMKRKGEKFISRKDSWSKAFPTTWRTTFTIRSIEEILEFDPFEEWEIPSVDELVDHFNREHSKTQKIFHNQVVPGGTYLTCFMWLIMTFGLKWTVKAAYSDPKSFERLINRFGSLSLLQFRAWAQTDIKVFISHDDICSTKGPFFSPKWLKRYIFPWYMRLWKELRSKNIVVLFCSDGDVTSIIDLIAKAGADGFIVEECTNLNYIAEKYGNDKVIVGGVDVGVLTYGTYEDVVKEVRKCINVAGPYPGYFINVSGSIPDNVPIRNLEIYFKACNKYKQRPKAYL